MGSSQPDPGPAGGHAAATSAATLAEDPARQVVVFVIVALALLMMAIDGTIVATVLHTLQQGLDTSINWAGWTITAYSFGFVVMLPISGRLAEIYGRRRVFICSVVAFTLASLFCGMADDIFTLIALRVLQAAGGAGFTPSATGIIVEHFGNARDRAVSLFGSIFPIGFMIGPIFGGLFVSYWSWRWAFYVNVPIGLAVVVLALRYVPRDAPRAPGGSPGRHPDIAGVLLLAAGLLLGMLGVSYLGEPDAGPASAAFLGLMAAAALALWVFFRHIGRCAHPFIAPHFIHGRGFGVVNLINAIFGGISGGAVVLVPLYAANRYGIDALGSGTLLIAEGLAAMVFSVFAALRLRRTGHRMPIRVGGTVVAVGLILIAMEPAFGLTPYLWLAAAAFLVGAGAGGLNPASRNAALQLAPEHSATLAALRTLSLQIGSITAVSLVTAVLADTAHPGTVQSWTYVAAAIILVASMPLIAYVPEHRGSW